MLDWHRANPEHRSALSGFRCTAPGTVTYDDETGIPHHDYPWEFEVQEHLTRLYLPSTPPCFILVGMDETGLAAVIEMQFTPLDSHCFVSAVGVAHRVSGNGLGGEALDRVHTVFATYYKIHRDYTVEALIDPDNWAAKSVFTGRGYGFVEMRGNYEVWAQFFPESPLT